MVIETGEDIRREREALGLQQNELARKLRMGKITLNRLERGKIYKRVSGDRGLAFIKFCSDNSRYL
jgi:ribosome-binding protein aMBF1 (putative translation factor)